MHEYAHGRQHIETMIRNQDLEGLLNQAETLHGHLCPPFVSLGVKAGQYAMATLNRQTTGMEEVVAIVEPPSRKQVWRLRSNRRASAPGRKSSRFLLTICARSWMSYRDRTARLYLKFWKTANKKYLSPCPRPAKLFGG